MIPISTQCSMRVFSREKCFASCGEMKSVELPLQDDGRSSGTGERSICFDGINGRVYSCC